MQKYLRLAEFIIVGDIAVPGPCRAGAARARAEELLLPGIVVLDEQGSILGVLTARDLAAAVPDLSVKDLAIQRATTLSSSLDIISALKIMLREDIGVHPVVGENGRLAGLVVCAEIAKQALRYMLEEPPPVLASEEPLIMVVDDSRVARKSLQKLLENDGYRTTVASSGAEALELIGRAGADAVLLDIGMPGMDGLMVLRRLREDPATRQVPVVMVTSVQDASSRAEAFELGADDYVLKPVDKGELKVRIERILRQRDELKRIEAERQLFLSRLSDLKSFNDKVVQQMDSGLLVLDLEGRVIELNQAGREMLGLAAEEDVKGRPVVAINPILDLIVGHPPSSRPWEMEYPRPDNTKVILSVITSPMVGPEGRPSATIASIRDLTAYKRMEQALREEREEALRLKTLLESVMDNMMSGLLVADNEGRILVINRSARKILECGDTDLLGRPVEELSPDIVVFNQIEVIGPGAHESTAKLPSGKWIPIGFSSSRLLDSKGEAQGVITVFRDLTEINQIQNELKEKEKLATIGQLAGGIAHEVKNPMFAITSGVQLLSSELELPEDQREVMDIMYREAMRVDRLIKNLLSYSARKELKRAPVLLTGLIHEVVALNQGLIKAKDIHVEEDFPPDIPAVEVDRDTLSQVLLNILQNAIEVSPDGGRIDMQVRLSAADRLLIIRIMDRGPGIPEELRPRVFDLFFSSKKNSWGMGLAISKKIVRDHGGDILSESREGGGTSFVIKLPLE